MQWSDWSVNMDGGAGELGGEWKAGFMHVEVDADVCRVNILVCGIPMFESKRSSNPGNTNTCAQRKQQQKK